MFLRQVWRHIGRDEVLDRAAALSYYFVFALAPTLLFFTAVVGLAPGRDLMEEFFRHVGPLMPNAALEVVRRIYEEAALGASGGLISVGALIALWGASRGMLAVMGSVNAAFGLREKRVWWRQRLAAIALTIGVSLMGTAGLLLLVFGAEFGRGAAERLGLGWAFLGGWTVARWLAIAAFATTSASLLYRVAPAVRRPWRWISAGSLFALFGWIAVSQGLNLYVGRFARANAVYGSLGGVVVLMLWMYFNFVVLLVGAEIESELERDAVVMDAAGHSSL